MNILINLLSSGSGGAMSYVRNLVPLLVNHFNNSSEHSLVLLVYRKHINEIGEIPESVTIIEIDKERGGAKRALWEIRAMPKILTDNKIDVFYTPYQLAPKARGVKTVAMIRNMEPFRFTNYRQEIKNYLRNVVLKAGSKGTLRRSDKVIAVSDYAKNECLNNIGVDSRRVTKIYHGRDTRFSPEVDSNDSATLKSLGIDGDYIFTCGSILPYRRVEYIVEAFNSWAGATSNKLVIAGSGNDKHYARLVDNLIIQSPAPHNILLVGQVSTETMRVLYRSCRLFVTATDIEACPNMGIEALSSGCHILSSDNEPMPEIFESAASYFSSGNINALCEAMPLAWEAAGDVNESALERASDFSWARCADQTYDALTRWTG